MGGKELREESKVWEELATGEARMMLMRKMIKEDLAFADLESFGTEFNNKLKSIKLRNKTLYKKVSGTAMKAKLADEQELRRELMKIKHRMKKDLAEEYGENSRKYRRIISTLNKLARQSKDKANEKYNKKIQHLREKYKTYDNNDEEDDVPEDLEEYADLSVFNKRKYENIETRSYDVKVIGEVTISDEEEQVLKLHPKFSVLEDLQPGGLDGLQEASIAKLRMEKEKNKMYEDFTEEERKEDERMEAQNRIIFNPKERTFDNRRRRVTDLKQCSRVTLPKPLSAEDESKIEVRKRIQKEIYEKYRQNNTNARGEQRSNLTAAERKGLRSLQSRINKDELIVMKTDKSSKFVITTPDEYIKMGEEHTVKDREISWGEVRELERVVHGHTVAWDQVWHTGEDHGHQDRVSRSRATRSGNQATLTLLYKDHKQGNKTRPVASGNESFNLGLSNGISEVLEAVARSRRDPYSVISAEDLLARVNKFNTEWRATKAVREEDLTIIPTAPKARLRAQSCPSIERSTRTQTESSTRTTPTSSSTTSPAAPMTRQRAQSCPREGDLATVSSNKVPKTVPTAPKARLRAQSCPSTGRTPRASTESSTRTRTAPARSPTTSPAAPRTRLRAQSCPGREDLAPSSNRKAPTLTPVLAYNNKKEITLIGNDVTALYPSLSAKNTARIIKEAIVKSEVDFRGFDVDKGRAYIAINSDLVENMEDIKHLIPTRKYKTGTKPTMSSITRNWNPNNQWEFPNREITDAEKKKIIGTVVEIALKILFNKFTYKFGGKYYHQQSGGPIGVRATGAASQIVMEDWGEQYKALHTSPERGPSLKNCSPSGIKFNIC